MSSDNSINVESGRKIEAQYENPVDNLFIMAADKVGPIFKSLNFTPNGITMLSTITGLGALYFLYQRDTTQFSIYLLISYFFDVMDGYYARKYGMVTQDGDRFDHYKDILMIAIGVYILYTRYSITNFPVLVVVILGLYFLSLIYLGCQEVMTSNENRSESLGFVREGASILSMDSDTCRHRMGMLRWFGSGSIILIVILSVLYVNGDFGDPNDLNLFGESGVVPGADDLVERLSTSDNTLPSIDTFDDGFDNIVPYRMDTFEPQSSNVVDISGMGGTSLTRADLDFINELRNFGSASLGSSTLGPYSSNMMVDRMIRD
jgi:phosphatidylglycerophosphate synthase